METESGIAPPQETCLYSDDKHRMCVWDHVVLAYSVDAPGPAEMRTWSKAMDQLEAPIAMLVAIDSRARAPDAAAREAIRAMVTKHKHRFAAFAHVVEGEGFGAAAMRSALSLMSLAARYPFPQRVTATVNEAAPWLLQHLPQPLRRLNDVNQIIRMMDGMRLQLNHRKAG